MSTSSPDHLRVRVRAVAGIVAAGMLVGGASAVVLRETGGWVSPEGAEAAAAARPAAVTATGAKPATQKPAVTPVATRQPATAPLQGPRTATGAMPVATTAGATPAAPATMTASAAHPTESVAVKRLRAATSLKTAAVQPATQVEEQIHYQYNTIGRRDPFEQMVGSFVGDDVGGSAPVDVGGVKVVGIVWGADSFALVEDGRGNSLILRRGDKVMNGFVEDLKRDAMIVKLTMDGQSQSVAIPLTRKGDQTNAIR